MLTNHTMVTISHYIVCQSILLHTFNLHNVMCQLSLNKAGGRNVHTALPYICQEIVKSTLLTFMQNLIITVAVALIF